MMNNRVILGLLMMSVLVFSGCTTIESLKVWTEEDKIVCNTDSDCVKGAGCSCENIDYWNHKSKFADYSLCIPEVPYSCTCIEGSCTKTELGIPVESSKDLELQKNICREDSDCEYIWFTGRCNTPEYVAKVMESCKDGSGPCPSEAPYREGVECSCENNRCVDNEPSICPMDCPGVCGEIKNNDGPSKEVTFCNSCLARKAGATNIVEGICPIDGCSEDEIHYASYYVMEEKVKTIKTKCLKTPLSMQDAKYIYSIMSVGMNNLQLSEGYIDSMELKEDSWVFSCCDNYPDWEIKININSGDIIEEHFG